MHLRMDLLDAPVEVVADQAWRADVARAPVEWSATHWRRQRLDGHSRMQPVLINHGPIGVGRAVRTVPPGSVEPGVRAATRTLEVADCGP
jgi:hypothetical protein